MGDGGADTVTIVQNADPDRIRGNYTRTTLDCIIQGGCFIYMLLAEANLLLVLGAEKVLNNLYG